ncbi:MAG: AmmeMemoRadiSam system protein B [Chromatiales bacterium]|nr:MAG: AmmeMemoRadiSam system protein B [Chromatiales bacterium]
MLNRREPAVAGLFYAADPVELREGVVALLRSAPRPATEHPKALIVPHAGYPYSGAVAAAAYRHLAAASDQVERVVLLGPAHRVWLEGLAVPSVDLFTTPLGGVRIDTAARDLIRELPGVQVSDVAHAQEHSLEVQLPFLQTVLGDFSLLPIVVGQCAPAAVAAVIDGLWGGAETLIVISSDLSHFHPYEEARRIDARTSQRILARATDLAGDEACGAAAVNGLMASHHAGDLSIDQVDLKNSGDTAGDRTRVVGYGAYVLH